MVDFGTVHGGNDPPEVLTVSKWKSQNLVPGILGLEL